MTARRLAIGAAFALLFAAPRLRAQTSDGGILGSVRDSAGSPVASATITARNAATGGSWSVLSNGAGRFALVQLPLGGPYTVTVRRIGFLPEVRDGYVVTLGRRSVADFTLRRAATELAPVVVTGAAIARAATLGGNLRIGTERIAAIPAVSRNFTDLSALAPTTGVQLSMLGQRWTSTDVRIDGLQARNMLRAAEFGAGPFTLSLEAIREFDVSTSVYDVTQGRQGGGSIRAATRSGTNEWTGSVFSYHRGSNLSAPTDYQSRSRAQRAFSATQWGGSVGGPLVRDRAQLFVAFDRWDSNEPVFSGLIQTPSDETSTGVARDSLTRLIQILGTTYGLDTTHAQVGRLDRKPVANTVFARMDIALSDRHRLTLTENLNTWNSPLSGGVDLPIALFEARSNYKSTEQQFAATLRTTLLSGVQNELVAGLSTSQRTLEPNSNLPRGFVRIHVEAGQRQQRRHARAVRRQSPRPRR